MLSPESTYVSGNNESEMVKLSKPEPANEPASLFRSLYAV